MRTISCKLEDLKNMVLHIGYEGENDYTSVRIDAGSVFAQYPDAVPSMKVQPPKGNMYPAIVTREGDIVIWNVSDSDTASHGSGEIQLTFTENTVVVKSCKGKTLVHISLNAIGPAPDPLIDFIDRAEEVVGEAQDAAEAAEAAAQHAPMIGLDGYWYKWDAETEEYVKTDTKARGEDGANGVGITSVEKISTVGLVDTYRINFTNGTNTTYTVTNGQDGSVPIDDTTPAANKVFSSAKVDEELTDVKTAIQGKYEKPSGGIPSTDMTQAVQDSLSAADSALIGVGKSEERDGIVQTGDTATKNIASGKYVIWKGSLYTASSNIATGETLSLSNLSPVSDGGFNALLDKIGEQSDEMEVVFDYTVEEENTGNNMILNLTKPCKKITCYIISTGNHPTQYKIKTNNYTLGYVNWTTNNVRHVMIIYDCVNKFGLVMSSTGGKSTDGWVANNNYILSNAIDNVHSISTIELTRDGGNDLVFPIGTTIKIYGK